MTKKKIAIIVIAILAALILLAAVCIETSVSEAKGDVVGNWSMDSSGIDYGLAFENYSKGSYGVVKKTAFGVPYSEGTWSYTWYNVTVNFEGEEPVTYKISGETLLDSNGACIYSKEVEKEEGLNPTTTVLFYKDGFFGFGEKGNFKYWSFSHFAPVILFAVAAFLIFKYREKLKNWKHEENFRFIFGAVMLFVEMSYFWRLLYVGSSETGEVVDLLDKLPLQVCEWTCILASFMIMKKSKSIYPICFYVCLTIGIFPILTPSVISTAGPAYYRFYQFWLEHLLPPLAVLYMTFVHGFRPTKKGIIPATCFMGVLVTFSLICNYNIPGANYLYLAEGTADGGGSILDPIRDMVGGSTVALLILLAALVVGMFFLVYFVHKWIIKLYNHIQSKRNAAIEEAPVEAQ